MIRSLVVAAVAVLATPACAQMYYGRPIAQAGYGVATTNHAVGYGTGHSYRPEFAGYGRAPVAHRRYVAAPYGYAPSAAISPSYVSNPVVYVPARRGYDVVTTLAVVGYAAVGQTRGYGYAAAPANAVLTKAYVPALANHPIKVIYTPQLPAGYETLDGLAGY